MSGTVETHPGGAQPAGPAMNGAGGSAATAEDPRGALFRPSLRERVMENRLILGGTGVIAFMLTWELAAEAGLINQIFTSRPTRWGARLVELLLNPELGIYMHSLATLRVLFSGLAIAVVVAIPLGIVIGWSKFLDRLTSPMIAIAYGVPYIALLPVIIIWFGIGNTARILIVVWAAIFPILINTTVGVGAVDRDLIRVGRAFCASSRQVFVSIVAPASVPYLVAGLRLAVGRALVAAIVAEFFMASRGLGYYINARSNALDSASAFAALFILAATGLLLVGVVARVEKRFSRWKEQF